VELPDDLREDGDDDRLVEPREKDAACERCEREPRRARGGL
jgi:hypothetical protein